MQMRDYVGDLTNSGPAVSSFGIDLLVVAVAGSIFIIVEARTFPLFLAMRQRRTTALARVASVNG